MTTKYPNVTIIVLTYNAEQYISDLLDSLQDQNYPSEKIQIIVADNCSEDSTAKIVRENYKEVNFVGLLKNYGFAEGNNKALEYSKNEYIAFLNQDTVCAKNWLISLVNSFLTNKKLSICSANVVSIKKFSKSMEPSPLVKVLNYSKLTRFGYVVPRINTEDNQIKSLFISGCSFMIKRKVIYDLGYLFDKDFWMYCEDTDLSLRLFNLGHDALVVKDAIVYHLHDYDKPVRYKSLISATNNRVLAFYKNLTSLEFLLYFPFLLLGSGFKIFSYPIPLAKRPFYFLPFTLVSTTIMVIALFSLFKFSEKKRKVIESRKRKTNLLSYLLQEK